MKSFSFFYSFLLTLISFYLVSCAMVNTVNSDNPAIKEGVIEFIESKDNPDMIVIPGGYFYMGTNTAEPNNRPEHRVYVGNFEIDKYETSAREFAEFLNAKGNPDDEYFSEDKYSTIVANQANPGKYIARQGLDNYPANNVSWSGAAAYCEWKGKRLPSEAEWEKAARGKDKRIYPWGNSDPHDARAKYNQKWEGKGFGVMVPVDAFPEGASYYGALNMAGNVWEWVDAWYRQSYCDECNPEVDPWCSNCYPDIQYGVCVSMGGADVRASFQFIEMPGIPEIVPEGNPLGPLMGSFRVLRGGSWYDSYGDIVIRTTYRYWFNSSDRYFNIGFRCAK